MATDSDVKALEVLGPRIMARNFEPGFYVEHFIKDMGIALAEANRMGIALPGMALAKQLYEALKAQGHGRDGTHALEAAMKSIQSGTMLLRQGTPLPRALGLTNGSPAKVEAFSHLGVESFASWEDLIKILKVL